MKIKKFKFKFKQTFAVLLILVSVLFVFSRLTAPAVRAEWFSDAWNYRIGLTFTNSGSADANKYITVTLTTNASPLNKLQANCNDARFTDAGGKQLQYYQTNSCQAASTVYHVLMPNIPVGGNLIYFYYGNPSAPAGKNSSDFTVSQFTTGTITQGSEAAGGGPLVYWGMDTNNNDTVRDSTGHGIDYPTQNVIVSGDCVSGSCYQFNGTSAFVAGNNSISPTFQITATADDGWEYNSNWSSADSNPWMGYDSGDEHGGFRFPVVTIPNSAQITSAVVQLYADGTDFTSPNLKLRIYADKVSHADVWSSTSRPSQITNSTAYVNWTPASWVTGSYHDTPDITSVVQEIVNQNGWSYGNAMRFAIKNNGTTGVNDISFQDVSHAAGFPAKLVVTYNTANSTRNALLNIGANSFTSSVWFKNTGSGSQTLVSRGTSPGYRLYTDASNHLCFGIDDDVTWGPDDSACSAGTYNDSKWHHAEAVKSGTSSITLYIDGVRVAQKNSLTANGSIDGTDLGLSPTASPFKGFLDDLKIYPYARTSAQVLTDYNSRGVSKGTNLNLGSNISNLTSGLVGYWKMDEATWSGTLAEIKDASGNSNDGQAQGTTNGKAYPGTGKFGKGGFFDGVDDWVSVPNSASLQNVTAGSFTFSTWFNASANPAPIESYALMMRGAGGDDGSSPVQIKYGFSNQITAIVFNTGNSPFGITTNSTYAINQWHLATMVVDAAAKTIFIYADGKLEGTTTYTGTIYDYGTSAYHIGRQTDNNDCGTGNAMCFKGNLDEARIYNRALTAGEVEKLYEFAPGPLAWWKFDEGSWNGTPDEVKDSSGNGYHGTTVNNPKTTTGKFGRAGLFNTALEQTINLSSTITLTNPYTIEFWAKVPNGYCPFRMALGYTGDSEAIDLCNDTNNGYDTLRFRRHTDNGDEASIGYSNLDINAWHHYTLTQEGSGNVRVYLDGTQGNMENGNDSYTALSSTFHIDQLSGGFWGITSERFEGYLDDIRLYDYVRTQRQILEDMNSGHPAGNTGSAAARWDFNETSGTTAHNSSPIGATNDLTLNSASWTTSGKFGNAWTGSGSTWLSNSSPVGLDFAASGADMTISAWAKHNTQTGASTTATYYFNANSSHGSWANWNNMTDGNTATYASVATNAQTEVLSTNENTGTNLGTITKVEVRYYGYHSSGSTIRANLQPVFGGSGNGTSWDPGNWMGISGGWSAYHDITTDTNAPGTWAWTDVQNLDSNVISNRPVGGTVYVSRVEIRVTYTPTNPGSEYLITKFDNTTGGYKLYMNNHKYCFAIDDDATWGPDDEVCTASSYDDNAWHQIIARKTGTSEISIYIDGVVRSSKTTLTAANTTANAGTFYIGDQDGTDNGDEFIGSVDDVQIFAAALTADEIKTLANQGVGTVMGSVSTVNGTASDSAAAAFCPPGDASACPAPVGWWKMDENSGTAVNDSSGSNITGTIDGSTYTWVVGKTGGGLKLLDTDGSNVVELTNTASVKGLSQFTFEHWIYVNAIPPAGQDFNAWYESTTEDVNYVRATLRVDNGYICAAGAKFSLSFRVGTSASTRYNVCGNTVPVINRWYHIAGIFDSVSGIHKLYVNGVLDNSLTQSVSAITNSNPAQVPVLGVYLNAVIDDVRLYNYARTPTQIAWDMNRGAPVAQYKFDECQGNIVHDSAPKANIRDAGLNGAWSGGTAVGTCTTAATAWGNGATGKYGASLSFNGTNDYVSLPNNAFNGLTTQGTITAWFKPNGNGTDLQTIFGSNDGNPSYLHAYELSYIYSSKTIVIFEQGCVNPIEASSVAAFSAPNIWHHVAWTMGTAGHTVYLDGQPVRMTYTQGSASVNSCFLGNVIGTTQYYRIGCDYDTNSMCANYDQLGGQVDDIRIYNYPLTSTQVKTLYNNGSAVSF